MKKCFITSGPGLMLTYMYIQLNVYMYTMRNSNFVFFSSFRLSSQLGPTLEGQNLLSWE